MLVVAVFVFLLLRLTPGDPAAIMAGDAANAEQIESIRAGLGLDKPMVVQFGLWLKKIVSGDLGESFHFRIKVTTGPGDTWSYDEDTVLQVRGRAELFHHRDRNTLRRIAPPTPNPLAR